MPTAQRYRVPDEEWADVARRALSDPSHYVDLATIDGRTVGFVHYYFGTKPWGTSLEIETLVVDEAHREREIGARLMEHAENAGRAEGAKGVRVHVFYVNERGKKFYEDLGYGPTSIRYGKTL